MASEPRIGREHYDSGDYFERKGSAHLTDPASDFHRYRVAKLEELRAPRAADRVVDLGCGWGTFAFAWAGRVADVVGVDFSERAIELCRRRLADEPHEGLRFLCADAGETGLEGGAWDLVVAADLFEHLYPEDSARVAREAYRLLAPGGHFAVWTPNPGHVLEMLRRRGILRPDPTHVDYKTMDATKRLLSDAGFAIERAYFAESHVPGLRGAERLLQRGVPFLRRRIAVLGRKPGAPGQEPGQLPQEVPKGA
ncbi:MAG TPA: class I SAM-dependent methyltransferase [Longimicrobiales bacterium]|nr:class I SAM-dependent methyltransferase [Longimicrobiales bacterium]